MSKNKKSIILNDFENKILEVYFTNMQEVI